MLCSILRWANISNCVQVRFYAQDSADQHILYLHEKYGIVEVVYNWIEGGTPEQHHIIPSWIVPIDGFYISNEAIVSRPSPINASNAMGGTWSGRVSIDTGEELSVELTLDRNAKNYDLLLGIYDIVGTYQDDQGTPIGVFGTFNERTGDFVLLSQGGQAILLYIEGTYSIGADPKSLDLVLYRLAFDTDTTTALFGGILQE